MEKKRQLIAYAELWHTANILIKTGESKVDGYGHMFRAALVFQAFAFEAALNHIGSKTFACWSEIEKLPSRTKLALISDKADLTVDYGSPPFQLLSDLLRYRNSVAHAHTENLDVSYETKQGDDFEDDLYAFTESKWEKFASRDNALSVRACSEEIVEKLYEALDIKKCCASVGNAGKENGLTQ